MDTIDRSTLEGKLLPELQQIAQTMGIEGSQRLRKAGLIDAIVEASSNGERPGNGEATTSSSRESAVAIGAVPTDADGHEEAGAAATAEPYAESATGGSGRRLAFRQILRSADPRPSARGRSSSGRRGSPTGRPPRRPRGRASSRW